MASVSMTVNGKPSPPMSIRARCSSQFLRENLRLTGTHVGCDTSQCGACVVHLDGRAVKSCTMLAVQCDGAERRRPSRASPSTASCIPMQAAFREHHGLQCGFCTPGMIMSAVDIVNRKGSDLDEHDDPRGARRQSLPLHRLPQHRQGRRRRRRGDGRGQQAAKAGRQ